MKRYFSIVVPLLVLLLQGCTMEADDWEASADKNTGGAVSYKTMADTLHTVLEIDRTVYTKLIINRLAVEEKVIKASEQWEEDKALVLPAQMFRASAEMLLDREDANFSFALISLWPINHQNRPRTEGEKIGLKFIEDNPGQNYYGEEILGGTRYFTALYPDVAIAKACASCHNEHKDSPRTDFKVGDVMGGVIIRIPM